MPASMIHGVLDTEASKSSRFFPIERRPPVENHGRCREQRLWQGPQGSSARLGSARPGPARLFFRIDCRGGGKRAGRQGRRKRGSLAAFCFCSFFFSPWPLAAAAAPPWRALVLEGERACVTAITRPAAVPLPLFSRSLARSLAHLPAGVVVVVRPAEHRWRAENGFLGQQAARSASTSVRPLLLANSAGILAGSSAGCLPATIPSGERAGGGFSSL